ncbi:MAG: hypothetical protein ACOC8K_03060 [Gemmatimonadota bacterium]
MSGSGGTGRRSSPVESWLAGRMERVPAEFRPWLEGDEEVGEAFEDAADRSVGRPDDETDPEIPAVAAALENRALRALRRAMSAPGRNRDSAFCLLAADAHLTWSAEALVERSDPESELRAFLHRVAAEGS